MEIKVRPEKHQVEGARFLLNRRSGLLCFGTGTGKSLIQIMVAMTLIKIRDVDRFLFFATKNAIISLGEDLDELTTLEEGQYRVLCEFEDLLEFMDDDNAIIGLVQYQTWTGWVRPPLRAPKNENQKERQKRVAQEKKAILERSVALETELRKKRVGISIDEAHTLKNPDSNVRKVFGSVRHLFPRCYMATATPVTSSIDDLFHLIRFLDPSILGSRKQFLDYYVEMEEVPVRRNKKHFASGQTPTRMVPKKLKNLELLRSQLDRVVLSYFPEVHIDFKKETARFQISEFERYLTAAEGMFGDQKEDGDPKQHSARLVDLQSVVNNSETKRNLLGRVTARHIDQGMLIFAAYYDSLDVIREEYEKREIDYRIISGKESIKKRREAKHWFVSSPEGKVLIITKAGGESLNLQATNRIVFFDVPFGIGPFVQTMGRVVRKFSSFVEFEIIFLTIEDTIDEYKFELVAAQREFVEKVFSNTLVPEGKLRSFDSELIRRLRREFLWKS